MDTHSPSTTSPSWLQLPDPAPATPEIRRIFDAFEAKQGFVRNQLRVLAHKPAIMEALHALGNSIARDRNGSLSGAERELIALVVSVENRCDPCVFSHAAALRGHGWSAERVGVVEVNYRRAELSPRERALADYALKVTRAAAEVEPADLQTLRDAGVDEHGILEAAAVTAFFNFSNKFNSALGVRANGQSYAANR